MTSLLGKFQEQHVRAPRAEAPTKYQAHMHLHSFSGCSETCMAQVRLSIVRNDSTRHTLVIYVKSNHSRFVKDKIVLPAAAACMPVLACAIVRTTALICCNLRHQSASAGKTGQECAMHAHKNRTTAHNSRTIDTLAFNCHHLRTHFEKTFFQTSRLPATE